MRDLNGPSNPLLSGRARGSAARPGEVPQLLMPQRRGFGLPIALGISTGAIALAGYLVLSELSGGSEADLPPASTPLEVAKTPMGSITGSLPTPVAPERATAPAVALASAPSPEALPSRPAAPAPARIQADQGAERAGPAAAEPARAPVSVVASAGPITALPPSLPPSVAPIASPAPTPAIVPPSPQAAPAPRGPSPAETAAFVNRARDLLRTGDIAGARLLLERAAAGEDGPALLALAETYDPSMLARWGVRGFKANVEKARALYQKAAERGVAAAQERILALR